jgi:hypothetical protein
MEYVGAKRTNYLLVSSYMQIERYLDRHEPPQSRLWGVS